ncbi:MAG: glycosyl transferase family 2 [Verrucomicrobiales bacterium]|nr:glycosyl transferase family 2 [Verrucomicrobiales bacterium]
MPSFSVTLIVNTFNQPEYLSKVLKGIGNQSLKPDEVLLADDGSAKPTRELFAEWSRENSYACKHIWQENKGFRRSRILNQAIAQSSSNYIVFLDGDTIPHPQFISDHQLVARKNYFVQGHRALIKEGAEQWFGVGNFQDDRKKAFFSGKLKGLKHAYRWPMAMTRVKRDLRGIRGCNLGIWRDDLIRTNGYNEEFVGWGREDSELAVRLMNNNVPRLDVRGRALCYHLWHPPASRSNVGQNDELLENSKSTDIKFCKLGLDQYIAK